MATKRVSNDLGEGFDYAVAYARHGWQAFPLMPGTKRPVPGSRGHLAATHRLDDLASIWRGALESTGLADLGVGFRCTGPAGFCVDLDVKNGKNGVEEFHDRVMQNMQDQPFGWDAGPVGGQWPANWLRYRTRSGGMHIIFATPADGRVVHTGRDVLGPGIDLRGPRGYRATYDPDTPGGYSNISEYVTPTIGVAVWFRVPDAPSWLLNDERLYARQEPQISAEVRLADGAACGAVQRASDPARWDFTDHHGSAARVLHLVRLGEEGHPGVLDALVELMPLYIEGRRFKSALDGQERDPEGDWLRMVEGALAKGTGAVADEDPCARAGRAMARFRL